MKNKHLFGVGATALLSLGVLVGCGGDKEYDEKGRMILTLKNVYFGQWEGADMYTEILNDKFGVKITPSNYSYEDWDNQVNTAINGDNITDTIHYNLKAYNFGKTYERWVRNDHMFKALPDNMSKWPNIAAAINKASNVNALKIDGKLYGIPILNDIKNADKDFSNMTYVYRKDVVRAIDQTKGTHLLREDDVYTWQEFQDLLVGLSAEANSHQKTYPIADEQWGFPSVTNFFKNSPHCYTKDANGRAINAFTSPEYEAGLEVAKTYVEKHYYSPDQYNYSDGQANKEYIAGRAYILYDNFSLANYTTLRTEIAKKNKNTPNFNLDEATAFLKVKDPSGKFAIEGTENWFSMTFFNDLMSDEKQAKILDIIEYLLTDEGTRFAIYGKEGYDYIMNGDQVELTEMGWERDPITGKIVVTSPEEKPNGARYLRYMASLGNETKAYDPFTQQDAYDAYMKWVSDISEAKAQGLLRIVREPEDIAWMSTPKKNEKTAGYLEDANNAAMKYAFQSVDPKITIKTIADYEAKIAEGTYWPTILEEINTKLGV